MNSGNLEVGKAGKFPVCLLEEDLANRHLLAVGKSGYGKTNSLKGLICQEAKRHMVIIPDTSESFGGLGESGDVETRIVDVYHNGIGIKPMEPIWFDELHREKEADTAMRFTSAMSGIYKLGAAQSSLLYRAVKQNMHIPGTTNEKFESMKHFLSEQQGDSAAKLCSRLEYLADMKVFSDKGDFSFEHLSGAGIVLIKLNHFPMQIKRLILELLLWELWRLFQENRNEGSEVTIVLDECQALDFSSGSPITKILTEGRKFHMNCWLATQFLNGNFNPSVISRLEQADVKLYFKPADKDLNYISGKLDSRNKKEWISILQGLGIGEMVLSGPWRLTGRKHREPVVVRTELQD